MNKGLLLDTCALLWVVNEPELLTEAQQQALASAEDVAVSAISAAEIACLQEKGRIQLDRHWKTWFERFTELNNVRVLDVSYAILTNAFSLPSPFHKDPCDRINVAVVNGGDSRPETSAHPKFPASRHSTFLSN